MFEKWFGDKDGVEKQKQIKLPSIRTNNYANNMIIIQEMQKIHDEKEKERKERIRMRNKTV